MEEETHALAISAAFLRSNFLYLSILSGGPGFFPIIYDLSVKKKTFNLTILVLCISYD